MSTTAQAQQAPHGQSCNVEPVQAWRLASYWDEASEFLAPAIEAYPDAGLDIETTRQLIEQRVWQLWVVEGYAAAVTEIATTYGQKVCTILLLGGRERELWFGQMLEVIEGWARANGCDRMNVVGRKGWERVGAPYGYKPVATVFDKGL